MDSNLPYHSKTANWNPGTLDQTRKAIGQIAPEEAAFMAKKLGGEVLNERSEPIHSSSVGHVSSRSSSAEENTNHSSGGHSGSNRSNLPQSGYSNNSAANMQTYQKELKHRRNRNDLPPLSQKACNAIDALMMSQDYQIKPNYGFFNFIRKLQKDGKERIVPDFYQITLKMYIENMEAFITVIKTLIQIAPVTYKSKIANGTEPKFKFLRMVAGWTMQNIKLAYIDLQDIPAPVLTADLIPVVRAVYKPLISVYYYGNTKIPKLIKEIYADETAYPDAPREKLSSMAKEAITEWLYLDTEIIHKLYPLLMRMCSDTYEEYPDFFTAKIAVILQFIGLHKFDLLLPEKNREPVKEVKPERIIAKEVKGKCDEIVNTGLNLLDQLFPQAGFKKLDSRPDLFPYFQPLYKFDDGFNMLSSVNPVQTVVVLLKIIEDCFQGCRNIKFKVPDKTAGTRDEDSITTVLDEWSAYRETVFEKLYCDPLKDLVNQVYSQPDFESSQFGKKLFTSILWQTTYHFLPDFKFDQLLLERPADESKYRPLFHRTDFVRKYLTNVVNECDAEARSKGTVPNLENPWEHYKFDIPNEISKRLDVLLGGQNTSKNTNATNANLLKYTLCFVAVLDWWINNPDSPAYTAPPMQIYRISPQDGKPLFSVPERNDQNKLFAEEIKSAYQHKSVKK
ncbi:MAG: hypothetical protein M0P01_10170 [Treponema sp.]|nr:hypothetical protein [Treponema sp.]